MISSLAAVRWMPRRCLFPMALSATAVTSSIFSGKRQQNRRLPTRIYPVYVDTNVMAGHTGPANESGEYEGLVYLPISAENDFTARIPNEKGRPDLPLLPQQPHRGCGDERAPAGLGQLRPRPTGLSFCSMPPTKLSSPIPPFPTPSTKSRGRGTVPSSSGPSLKMQALPAPVAP